MPKTASIFSRSYTRQGQSDEFTVAKFFGRLQLFLELVTFKAYAELKAEAARHYISFLWWIVEPILHMGVYYIVFGLVLNRGGDNFVPFLLSGIVIWKWFSSSVNQGADSILNNTGLIRQVYIPKYVLPGAILLANTARFFFVFVLLIIFLMIYGIYPHLSWVSIPVLFLAQFLLIAALGGFFSVIVPFVPDVKLLIENLLTLLFFLSGVFFYLDSLSENLRAYFLMNPMALLIDQYRGVLLYGRWPEWHKIALIIFISLIGIGVTQYLMVKLDRFFAKVLM